MDRFDVTATPDRDRPSTEGRPAGYMEDQRSQSCLVQNQRWLAWATAIAVLLSGLNASVQVWKVAAEHHGQQLERQPGPLGCSPARRHG